MPAPVRNDLGNKITFIAKQDIKEGQAVFISDGDAMEVDLFVTAGGRPDGIATNNTKLGQECSVAFSPALVPVLVGNATADVAVTSGGSLKTTVLGEWSLAEAGDAAGTVYPVKATAATGKGGLGSGMLLSYGSVAT